MQEFDFVLKETDGKDISLKDFRGKNVVLYFYPKDNTSGCTAEALEFVELLDEFEEYNTVVIGVSRDSLKSHAKFKDKFDIPFLLLSDAPLWRVPLPGSWCASTSRKPGWPLRRRWPRS